MTALHLTRIGAALEGMGCSTPWVPWVITAGCAAILLVVAVAYVRLKRKYRLRGRHLLALDAQLAQTAALHAATTVPGSAQANHLHTLAESSSDIIYRFRLGTKPGFEYVNPAAERLTGYTAKDFYGDPNFGLTLAHPADRHLFADFMKGRAVFGTPAKMRWIRRQGGVLVTEQVCMPVKNVFGGTIAIEGVARDVTRPIAARHEDRN